MLNLYNIFWFVFTSFWSSFSSSNQAIQCIPQLYRRILFLHDFFNNRFFIFRSFWSTSSSMLIIVIIGIFIIFFDFRSFHSFFKSGMPISKFRLAAVLAIILTCFNLQSLFFIMMILCRYSSFAFVDLVDDQMIFFTWNEVLAALF